MSEKLSRSNEDRPTEADETDEEIERPRLEDLSRASLLHLPHDNPSDHLMLLLPHRYMAQDPLLSSTLMQESTLEHDWPNASSIRLANSRDSVGLSERLNNADICLEASTSQSASASAAAVSGSDDSASASESSSVSASSSCDDPQLDGDATSDASIGSLSASAEDDDSQSSPRLRVLASATVDGAVGSVDGCDSIDDVDSIEAAATAAQPSGHRQHHQQPPQALGLLQVCRLTLDVLSEGGLLSEDAGRWLTPELLCDKLCDRLCCPLAPEPPRQQPNAPSDSSLVAAAAAGAPSTGDFDSPRVRVRQWLLGGDGGGDGRLSGSPLRRYATNSL